MLFGPLACLEVQSSRIEGNVVVLSVRLNINLNAEPIEKVVARAQRSIESQYIEIQNSLRRAGCHALESHQRGPS